MARIRTVKPETWHDEKLGRVSRDARLTFIGLWNLSDDTGRFRANPAFVRSQLFPYDEDTKVPTWMAELEGIGVLKFYTHGGEFLGVVVNFPRHQQINRPSPSKLPGPEDEGCAPASLTESSVMAPRGKGREGKGREGKGSGSVPPVGGDAQIGVFLNTEEPKPPKPQEIVFAAWKRELRKPDLPMGRDDFSIIGARLKDGCTVEQLCLVPVGARRDAERWPERRAQDEIKFLFGSLGQVRKFVDLASAQVIPRGESSASNFTENRPPPGRVKV